MTTVTVGVGPVSFADVLAVARDGAAVELHPDAVTAIEQARLTVEKLAAAPTPSYGISTGFGALATRHIPTEMRAQLQKSLVRSHAAGSGPEVEREVTRALMLLRLSTLATGHTGVRPVVAQTMAAMLTHGITPVVHEYGSLGCSGDLAPLSHCALALMGEGEVSDPHGVRRPAAVALSEAGLAPVELEAKEGLALINGTDGMLGMLVLAIGRPADAAQGRRHHRGDERRGPARHRPGLRRRPAGAAPAPRAGRLRREPRPAARRLGDRRQPPRAGLQPGPGRLLAALLARRCTAPPATPSTTPRWSPPASWPPRSTTRSCSTTAGSSPTATSTGRRSAYVLDFLAIVAADVASISERRTDRFLDQTRSHGLPPFLAHDPGVDSGHMIAQYTQAAIVSEMKRLANPASVDSIPSSAMQEDHVSMGWSAARKLRRSVDGLARVVAIEYLTAARALDLRGPLEPSPATAAAVALLRRNVEGPGPDRHLSPEIEHAFDDVRSGALVRAVEDTMGELA